VGDKLDGISLLLVKKDGRLSMYTRGNGIEGRDVSHIIDKITGVPSLEAIPEGMIVRGEAVVPRREFIADGWAEENPKMRNFVAGAIGAKTLNLGKLKAVHFVA
jgi:NAD-dependent DNA ligase